MSYRRRILSALAQRAGQACTTSADIGLAVHAMGLLRCPDMDWLPMKRTVLERLRELEDKSLVTCLHCFAYNGQCDVGVYRQMEMELATRVPAMDRQQICSVVQAMAKVHSISPAFRELVQSRAREIIPQTTKLDIVSLARGSSALRFEDPSFFAQLRDRIEVKMGSFSHQDMINTMLGLSAKVKAAADIIFLLMDRLEETSGAFTELRSDSVAMVVMIMAKANSTNRKQLESITKLVNRRCDVMQLHELSMCASGIAKLKGEETATIRCITLIADSAFNATPNTVVGALKTLSTTSQRNNADLISKLVCPFLSLERVSVCKPRDVTELLCAVGLGREVLVSTSSVRRVWDGLVAAVRRDISRYSTVDLIRLLSDFAADRSAQQEVVAQLRRLDIASLAIHHQVSYVAAIARIQGLGYDDFVRVLQPLFEKILSSGESELNAQSAVIILDALARVGLRRLRWMDCLLPIIEENRSRLQPRDGARVVKAIGMLYEFRLVPETAHRLAVGLLDDFSPRIADKVLLVDCFAVVVGASKLSLRHPASAMVLRRLSEEDPPRSTRLCATMIASVFRLGGNLDRKLQASVMKKYLVELQERADGKLSDLQDLSLVLPYLHHVVGDAVMRSFRASMRKVVTPQMEVVVADLLEGSKEPSTFLFHQMALAGQLGCAQSTWEQGISFLKIDDIPRRFDFVLDALAIAEAIVTLDPFTCSQLLEASIPQVGKLHAEARVVAVQRIRSLQTHSRHAGWTSETPTLDHMASDEERGRDDGSWLTEIVSAL